MKTIQLKWLLIGAFIASVGNSFIWPLTSVYLHNDLHQSLTTVGIILLLYSGANIVGSYASGWLFDHHNPYHLMLVGVLVAGITTAFLILYHGWPAYPIALIFLGLGTGWLMTLTNALGTTIKGRDGRYIFNMLYFCQNLGIVVGTSVVGFVYSVSLTLPFAIVTAFYVILLLVVFIKYRPAANIRHSPQREKTASSIKLSPVNARVIITVFFALAVVWIMYQQWVSNLSVYMTGMGIPMRDYSLLWTLNAGLIVVFQILINWLSQRVRGEFWQIYFGLFFVTLSFFVLIWAHQYRIFVIAMTVLTIGEATAFPAIPALVNDLTPMTLKGKYQGLTNAWASAGKALGPLIGGLIIEALSYRFLFILAGTTILMILMMVIYVTQANAKKMTHYQG
ncbi:MDR family MFS transporter [Secundilactobacillus folii]|uniref:MFS transporter n=1 Tax=Secundilactobacillus folii TaxID=2678357 RepID=A0A7X3C2P1_9LACO|nr:MFS transporter [Secundilactobacillus folii]MTV81449.1 MFS transporter [Secundilactobacillus folii]